MGCRRPHREAVERWIFIPLRIPGTDFTVDAMNPNDEGYLAIVNGFIGDSSIKAELLRVSEWRINESEY
jgi:hypothetical protein